MAELITARDIFAKDLEKTLAEQDTAGGGNNAGLQAKIRTLQAELTTLAREIAEKEQASEETANDNA
jgi:hypothetical protein